MRMLQTLDPTAFAQPAACMPAQFFDQSPGRPVPPGIRRLMVAILEDAISVYRANPHASTAKRRRLHAQARRWLASDDRSWIFSFLRITEALGIDAPGLRRRLRLPSANASGTMLPQEPFAR